MRWSAAVTDMIISIARIVEASTDLSFSGSDEKFACVNKVIHSLHHFAAKWMGLLIKEGRTEIERPSLNRRPAPQSVSDIFRCLSASVYVKGRRSTITSLTSSCTGKLCNQCLAYVWAHTHQPWPERLTRPEAQDAASTRNYCNWSCRVSRRVAAADGAGIWRCRRPSALCDLESGMTSEAYVERAITLRLNTEKREFCVMCCIHSCACSMCPYY